MGEEPFERRSLARIEKGRHFIGGRDPRAFLPAPDDILRAVSQPGMREIRVDRAEAALPPIGGPPPRALLDRDCLLLAIEASVRVRSRTQFFSWAQGALQAILPHEFLLYEAYDRDGGIACADVIAVHRFTSDERDAWLNPESGLLSKLREFWNRHGKSPMLLNRAPDDEGLVLGTLIVPAAHFKTIAFHGVSSVDGTLDSFFAFTDISVASPDEIELIFELVLPSLRAALVRMQSDCPTAHTAGNRGSLSVRERQVLRLLKDGRSNVEIGATLEISPLTVKNHVQKLLRKLGVRNRTQAVAMEAARAWRIEK